MEFPPAPRARGPAVGKRRAEANVLHSEPQRAPLHGEIEEQHLQSL